MSKIFHVFISSTFIDLRDERKKTNAAVAKAGYVAEGMEIFPASSQNQMAFIKNIIDRCDYYILILGGKYGSVGDDGISFTEKEFQYAIKSNIPVLAFLHNDISELPAKKVETDKQKVAKLNAFKDNISGSTLIDYWSTSDELAKNVLAALSQARTSHPGVGWIKASSAASNKILGEINELRKTNDRLTKELKSLQSIGKFNEFKLADIEDKFEIKYKLSRSGYNTRNKVVSLSWLEILGAVGLEFRTPSSSFKLGVSLKKYILTDVEGTDTIGSISIEDRVCETIVIQFEALGFFKSEEYKMKVGNNQIFYRLTEAGTRKFIEQNVIRKK